jgi:NTP pyrophosphatase (non-canonical NTP hydrolase)
MKTLNELRDEIHENAVKYGFYDVDLQLQYFASKTVEAGVKHALFAQKIALIHSELSEALEADRKNDYLKIKDDHDLLNKSYQSKSFLAAAFNTRIKNTVEDELADVIIRALDLCGYLGIDIERHVELKMAYNELREYKHGKNY